ncbi:putative pala protein [Serendipita vermifera]|nr:putative pala protein [Serendipita vermifera]
MSNQLVIPFKRTTQPPIEEAVRDHISKYHPETVLDAFNWDIEQWESLRNQATSGNVHTTIVDIILKYHAQLVLMMTKLPVDINLSITYYHAFQASQPPVTLSNLAYERVCILFNLAALFCQLAEAQNRTGTDGLKRASAFYQNAAGTFTYILDSAMPPFVASLTHPMSSSDLSKPIVKALEYLMLAQAAECYWAKAVMDNLRNGTIARLSMQVASFYSIAHSTIQGAPTHVGAALPPTWMAHLQTKQYHFEAAAQIRKSMDESENSRYGIELARLANARIFARKGQESARKGVGQTISEDINTLCAWIEDQTTKAGRDNDYIYHQEVPPISALEIIEPANLVNSAVLSGLRDPQTSLNGDDALFGNLTSWGARTAIDIYNDRKTSIIAEIRKENQELDRIATAKLDELNLPASLESMDKPVGLPATLMAKAAQVRADEGPRRVIRLLEDVETLANQNRGLLNEAYDILEIEADEDETHRQTYGKKWTRLPSHTANMELTANAEHYNTLLKQATATDVTVTEKWKEWGVMIETLALDENKLAALPTNNPSPKTSASPLSTQTKSHMRILRGHLESLDEIRRNRQLTLIRLQNFASSDDISDRIKLVALGLERWTEVKAEMFEDVMTEELQRYEKYRNEISSTEPEQRDLLRKIEERNASLHQSRQEDPVNKGREKLFKSLDTAYTKYKEIVKNCSDGLDFYNALLGHLTNLRENCRDWAYSRRQDVNALIDEIGLMDLDDTNQQQSPTTPLGDDVPPPPTLSPPGSSPETTTTSPPPSPSTLPSSTKRSKGTPRSNQAAIIADLPHPNSSQWQPLVPVPSSSSPTIRTNVSSKYKRNSREENSPAAQSSGSNAISKPSKPKRQIY